MGVPLLVKLLKASLLKVALLHGCSRFLNCKNGTKSRKLSQIRKSNVEQLWQKMKLIGQILLGKV